MRLGIYGGTFNPVHMAHLLIAERVTDALSLERLLFIPCAVPPLKPDTDLVPGNHRYEMVKIAISGNPRFSVSDLEIRRAGKSYTIDTVTQIASEYQLRRDELFLIIGADNLPTLPKWKNTTAIHALCRFVLVRRPHHTLSSAMTTLLDDSVVVDVPLLEISSSEVRARVAACKSVRYMVPEGVLDYIQKQRLYL